MLLFAQNVFIHIIPLHLIKKQFICVVLLNLSVLHNIIFLCYVIYVIIFSSSELKAIWASVISKPFLGLKYRNNIMKLLLRITFDNKVRTYENGPRSKAKLKIGIFMNTFKSWFSNDKNKQCMIISYTFYDWRMTQFLTKSKLQSNAICATDFLNMITCNS